MCVCHFISGILYLEKMDDISITDEGDVFTVSGSSQELEPQQLLELCNCVLYHSHQSFNMITENVSDIVGKAN